MFVVRMSNHEKSKKHRELVAILKAQLEEEEDGLELQVSFTILRCVVLKTEHVDSFMMDRTLLRSRKMFLYLGMHHLAGFIEVLRHI